MKLSNLPFLLLILPSCLLGPTHCEGAERSTGAGARESALGLATVALPTSFSIFYNPALLTEYNSPWLTAGFCQPYAVAGYRVNQLALGFGMVGTTFGIGISQVSVFSYHETNLGIAIAKKLSGKCSAGLMINYFDLNLPESGQHRGTLQVDGGLYFKVSEKLFLGCHFQNVLQSRLETFQYHLTFPILLSCGLSYHLTDQLLLAGETQLGLLTAMEFRSGLEFEPFRHFWLRGGMLSNPFRHAFGFGYAKKRFQLDFAAIHHPILGFSPVFSITFQLKP